MKIRFRIGVEREGSQPPQRPASATAKVRFLHPGRFRGARFLHPGRFSGARCLYPERSIGARFLRPFTLLALTKEGSSREGERSGAARLSRTRRISAERFRQAGRTGGTRLSAALPDTQKAAPATRKLLKIEPFFAKWAPTSNRQWPANRCYRKQRTKPRLTGTRTAIRDFGFLTLFARGSALNFGRVRNTGRGPRRSQVHLARRQAASTTKSPGEIERFCHDDCTTSTRFCAKSRSYTKQMIKPFLPGATTTHCDATTVPTFSVRRSCPDEAREHRRTGAVQATHISLANPRRNRDRGPRSSRGLRVRQSLWRTSTVKDFRRGARMLLLPGETATNGLYRTHPE